MLKLLACALVFLAISCKTPSHQPETVSRDPQSHGHFHEEDQKTYEETFQSLIRADAMMEQDKAEIRSQKMESFMQKQMGLFYSAQDLVSKFDQELDKLHAEKTKNPKATVKIDHLLSLQIQLNAGREVIENSRHELEYVYTRLLTASQSTPTLQTASQTALNKMDQFFKQNWEKGDRWAVHSLATELESVNTSLKVRNPGARILDFSRFTRLNLQERTTAIRQSFELFNKNRAQLIDERIQKSWNTHIKLNLDQQKKFLEKRLPQNVTMQPSPGAGGSINGSNFPSGVWALTYDDGPHGSHTRSIIKELNSGGYQATFFWLTKNMNSYKSIVDDTRKEGHRRASHSYTHANLQAINGSRLDYEITQASEDFAKIVGEPPTFFRCPYGNCGASGGSIRQKIAQNKMIHAMWNVDSLDWQDKNSQSIFNRVRKQMEVQGRGIVLFHDIQPQTVEATRLLVNYLKARSDWQVLPLEQIVSNATGSSYHSP